MADSKPAPSPPVWAILNGTSRTGIHLAELALARGSAVHTIVRSAARLPARLTAAPSPKLHVHELPDLFAPAALQPILAGVDVLSLALGPPVATLLRPTSLNTDAAVAAVAAIRAATPAGARPRTRVLLLAGLGTHPDMPAWFRRVASAVIGQQMTDLARARAYLATQAVWGLEHAAVCPGKIVEATPGESVEQRLAGAVLSTKPADLRGQDISYGRLAGAFVQAAEEWERWRGGMLVPVPVGEAVRARAADKYADVWPALAAHGGRLLRKLAWVAVWMAIGGWLAGGRFGDLGSALWMQGRKVMGLKQQ